MPAGRLTEWRQRGRAATTKITAALRRLLAGGRAQALALWQSALWQVKRLVRWRPSYSELSVPLPPELVVEGERKAGFGLLRSPIRADDEHARLLAPAPQDLPSSMHRLLAAEEFGALLDRAGERAAWLRLADPELRSTPADALFDPYHPLASLAPLNPSSVHLLNELEQARRLRRVLALSFETSRESLLAALPPPLTAPRSAREGQRFRAWLLAARDAGAIGPEDGDAHAERLPGDERDFSAVFLPAMAIGIDQHSTGYYVAATPAGAALQLDFRRHALWLRSPIQPSAALPLHFLRGARAGDAIAKLLSGRLRWLAADPAAGRVIVRELEHMAAVNRLYRFAGDPTLLGQVLNEWLLRCVRLAALRWGELWFASSLDLRPISVRRLRIGETQRRAPPATALHE